MASNYSVFKWLGFPVFKWHSKPDHLSSNPFLTIQIPDYFGNQTFKLSSTLSLKGSLLKPWYHSTFDHSKSRHDHTSGFQISTLNDSHSSTFDLQTQAWSFSRWYYSGDLKSDLVWIRFQMWSEILKPSHLKSGQMAVILSKTIWNLDKNVQISNVLVFKWFVL